MSDWDQRMLCPDGGCVGLIGPDGTCKVCGRVAPNWGDERKRGLIEPAGQADEEADDDAHDDENDENDALEDEDEDEDEDGDMEGDEDGRQATNGEWTTRTLCPDGGCVGVIGADGRCKMCGRSAA